jgi:serine-type D-Ala-D-Ala carboxypeptidase (penicillin-binding protein 5/6)
MVMSKHKLVLLLWILYLPAGFAVTNPIPAPPTFDAKSYILMDANSDEVLAGKNADERIAPASITKLMTAYVVFKAVAEGHIGLEDQVLVSEKAWRMAGSRMFIEVGKRVKVDDLLKGMIIQSGNDASVALAEHVAGSEEAFVNIMNAEVANLGLANTHYVNATGLPDPQHYTTARDIALLAKKIIREFPDQYPRYSERKFTYNGITQYNRNKLLWRDESVDGLKTGHTETAGYCLASSAERDTMRLIAVVMGTKSAKSRVTHSQSLLNYGFRFFETHKLYQAGQPLAEPRIWKGEQEHLPLGLAEDLYITIPRGQYDDLDASMEFTAPIDAPVQAGAPYGKVVVALNATDLKQEPLIALKAVPKGDLWRQAMDTVLLWFE